MLKNEYLIAKFGLDTAENEPRKEWCVVAVQLAGGDVDGPAAPVPSPHLNHYDSFRGSFSAGSTPIFATKASFCSIKFLRDLQNELAEYSKLIIFAKNAFQFSPR